MLATVVYFHRVVVGLAAHFAQAGRGTHPGSGGVDMKVASHVYILKKRYEQHVKRPRIVRECVLGTI
jgi:hypothetical protein